MSLIKGISTYGYVTNNKSIYEGKMQNGLYHGYGKLKNLYNGKVYEGIFNKGIKKYQLY